MELDEETRKDVNQKIIENTNRITGLVNKMLELSDANSKTVLDRNDHIPAIQVVALAMDSFSNTEKYKIPIDLELGEGTDSLMITTNEQAARRALTLLLDNAEKFTKEGKITLKTEVDDKQVRFIVEDTGIGIPADKAEVIFEEFVQLDDYYEGTGIGLTVARSLCRRLEGEIVLDTSYTGGARFIMTLPLDSPQSQN
jgi:signal transduction histidine kinase